MKINIHAGHNADGKTACGAIGLIKESTEARNVKNRVVELLKEQGHTVFDCTVDDALNQSDNLKQIVTKCNSNSVDLDISIHFNAAANDTQGNGKTTGCEVFVYDENSTTKEQAKNVCNAIAELGFKNRGVKTNANLYVLKNTKAPAILIECCFVDDKDDTDLYDCDAMALAIVRGLLVGMELQTSHDVVGNTEVKKPGPNTFTSYVVTINAKSLNVRKGPGMDHDVVKILINDKNKYTIVDEQDGKGAAKWCKLKSGLGWISKDFVNVDK